MDRPSLDPGVDAAAGCGRCPCPCLRSRGRVSRSAPRRNICRRTRRRRCCSRCATGSASRAASSSRRAATAPTMPRRWPASPSRVGPRAASPSSTPRSATPNWRSFTPAASAASGSTFSSGSSTTRRRTRSSRWRSGSRRWAGTRSSISRPTCSTELTPFLAAIPTIVVVDHLGRPDIGQGPGGADIAAFVALLDAQPHLWAKVSGADRLSLTGAPYDDFVAVVRPLVRRFPDRVLWGSDWPHPNMESNIPDDGALVDVIPQLAPAANLQRAMLIENPARLYWSD